MTQTLVPTPYALDYLSPVGCGEESKILEKNRITATAHFYVPVTINRQNLPQRFKELSAAWRQECLYLSSITDMVMHPFYQQIIALGPSVIPLILRQLEKEPDHWFFALQVLTGEDPVSAEDKGKLKQMTSAWINWGKLHNLI